MPAANSLAWKTSLEKSGRCGIAAIKGAWRFTYDWSWWTSVRTPNRPLQRLSGLHCRALVMVSSSIRLTAWLPPKKRAERSEVMYEQLPRLSPLWLSASSSACHGLLIFYRDNAVPTKPSATKMPENWSWRTRQLLTCRCVSVMLLRSMQNTRRS